MADQRQAPGAAEAFPTWGERRTARAREIVRAARELLEESGAEKLTMRSLADRLGIKAPSLYKHFPDKSAVEVELIAQMLDEIATVCEAAAPGSRGGAAAPGSAAEAGAPGSAAEVAVPSPLEALTDAYRAYALSHPHLYRLATERPLPRHALPEGLEDRAAAPLVRACAGDGELARAAWAFAHGMVILEIHGRFPEGADLGAAWRKGTRALIG